MARVYVALALLALIVSNAAASPSLGIDGSAPFPVEVVAPGPLPELPTIPGVTGKYLAKISGARVIISGVRDKIEEVAEQMEEAVSGVVDGGDA